MSLTDELKPTDMVLGTLREMFVRAPQDAAHAAIENGTGALVTDIAHLIDATAATSYAKGLRRAHEIVASQGGTKAMRDRIDEIVESNESINARKGYPGRVSMIDPAGKIVLLQVDGTAEEVRPLALHLRDSIAVLDAVLVVLPIESSLQALDDEGLRLAGLAKRPTEEEIQIARDSLAEARGAQWSEEDMAVVTAKAVLRSIGEQP